MHTKITPFSEADIEEAAELLAHRHQGDRVHEPALPERFSRPSEARLELEQTMARPAQWAARQHSGLLACSTAAWHRQHGAPRKMQLSGIYRDARRGAGTGERSHPDSSRPG